ncbi:hypothetical protein BIFGAL_03155 [Bifidobacterium gallicum DSM 20093 = LMG 11596]|nr:hypothetical protein BIFGAL_03155 [Bifidobacterium gallicum DSM 20093 = LMG 11596]
MQEQVGLFGLFRVGEQEVVFVGDFVGRVGDALVSLVLTLGFHVEGVVLAEDGFYDAVRFRRFAFELFERPHACFSDGGVGIIPACAGLPARFGFPLPVVGIIPACAGLPSAPHMTAAWPRNHPRVCGATFTGSAGCTKRLESSPRVRGYLQGVPRVQHDAGIIPACAGLPLLLRSATQRMKNHPRVCGATNVGEYRITELVESSPRVRGYLTRRGAQAERGRIIPACAGLPHPSRCAG